MNFHPESASAEMLSMLCLIFPTRTFIRAFFHCGLPPESPIMYMCTAISVEPLICTCDPFAARNCSAGNSSMIKLPKADKLVSANTLVLAPESRSHHEQSAISLNCASNGCTKGSCLSKWCSTEISSWAPNQRLASTIRIRHGVEATRELLRSALLRSSMEKFIGPCINPMTYVRILMEVSCGT